MLTELNMTQTQTQTQTLPDTEPLLCDGPPSVDNACWGRLLPIGSRQPTTVLVEECYTVGRSPKCEIFICEELLGKEAYNTISKYHFQIRRSCDDDGVQLVYLQDMSVNGTFVNGRKVGRGAVIVLANSDQISLSQPNHSVFVFMDSKASSSEWLTDVLSSEYQILKHLGTGGFSEVKLVIDKKTCKKYALKKISKDRMEANKIYNEVKLLQRINHPFIINFERIRDTSKAIFICLEYMPRGDLMKRLETKKKLEEHEALFVVYQLALALEYLHDRGIIHRDVKAENVLIERELLNNEPRVKLTDFGLSKVIEDSSNHLRTTCGTLKYMAPEILLSTLTGPYTGAVDVWSLGVLLFLCLSGDYPFDDTSKGGGRSDLAVRIVEGDYKMSPALWQAVSDGGVSLVKRMLVTRPDQRITLAQILIHIRRLDALAVKKVDTMLEIGADADEPQQESKEKRSRLA